MATVDDVDASDLWPGEDMDVFDNTAFEHGAQQNAMVPVDPSGEDLNIEAQIEPETLCDVFDDAGEDERQELLESESFQQWLANNGYVKEESLEESAPEVAPIPNSLAEWARDQYGNQWADFAKRHGLPESAPVSPAAVRLATRAVQLWESGRNYP